MKQKIYVILIIIIIAFIFVSSYQFYINKENIKETEMEVSAEPVENTFEEDILYVEITEDEADKKEEKPEKPIESNSSDWNLILVNKDNLIPEDYELETEKLEGNWKIDSRAKESAQKMLADARKKGLDPIICSAYRSSSDQKILFRNKVNQYKSYGYSQSVAEEKASYWVAIPGTSEHEVGLALDIVSRKYQNLDKNQENTAVQKWLMEHCYEYGFILRYPTDKKDITKINYEPWHYRYVGVENAMFIKEKGFCLEEYIEFLKEFE